MEQPEIPRIRRGWNDNSQFVIRMKIKELARIIRESRPELDLLKMKEEQDSGTEA